MPNCSISSGYAIDCRDGVGGNKEVYIIDFYDVTAVAEASGLVTGITKASGKRFYKFEIPEATAEGKDTPVGNTQNGSLFFNHEFTMALNKRDAATRNIILVLGKARVIIVARELSGRWTMYGKDNGLWLTTGEGTSGIAGGDRNGYNLTFAGEQREPVLEVTNAVGLALQTPG
jgi:hypothetical protein